MTMLRESIRWIILSLFAAVTFAAACGVLPAQAADGYSGPAQHCICGSRDGTHLTGCDGTEVSWTAWTTTDSLPTNGYYYLATDVTLTADASTIATTLSASLWLDLNGHTINSPSSCAFLLSGKTFGLTVLDSSTAGTGKIISTGSPTRSAFFFLANSGS